MSVELKDTISFDMARGKSNVIKVIGVGGGGSNAVDYMYDRQIKGVDFVICNTDSQALENSAIPNKIQLGVNLTSGLGAGSNPETGAQAAVENIQEIQQMLDTNTKMVFITAGMGGGTGTGAAPIIAKTAKDMEILTVGIVTIPFKFEGRMRIKQAEEGIDKLRKNVDSLIIINNNKLREVYGDLGYKAGFSKADEVLSTAVIGIAKVITHHYKQNIDLHDAKTVLSNSGTAIMGSAKESGEDRARNAIINALDSPLLNDNKINGAKNVLLLIVSGTKDVTLDEIGEINDYIQEQAGFNVNIIMGVGDDESLNDGISVTIIATGFAPEQQNTITNTEEKKIIYTLENEQKTTLDLNDNKTVEKSNKSPFDTNLSTTDKKTYYLLDDDKENNNKNHSSDSSCNKKEVLDNDISPNDFIITDVTKKVDEIDIEQESKLKNKENNKNKVSLKSETPKIEKRYTLDGFEDESIAEKNNSKVKTNDVEKELQFELHSREESVNDKSVVENKEVSPLNLTISQLKNKTEERRKKMKGFNYKFSSKLIENIAKLENQPAFKRQGIKINLNAEKSKEKRTLKNDSDDNFLLNSNNSFLHDNVD